MGQKSRVFLSHSSKDKQAVRKLAEDLRAAGVDVWLDEEQIAAGESIAQKLQEGLKRSAYLAIWLTENATSSGWVETEWQTMLHKEIAEHRIIVLPLLAETCEIPPLLRDKRFVDFRGDYSAGLADLLRSLGARRECEAVQPSRAVILAGGLAMRLWPLTTDQPKALLRLAGGTLLQHLVSALNTVPRIEEVLVSVDAEKANYFSDVKEQLQKASNYPLSVVEHASVSGKIKGPVAKLSELVITGRLQNGLSKWNIVVGVDNVFTFSLKDFLSFAQRRLVSANAVIEMKATPTEFGVARTTGDILDSVLEKPQQQAEVVSKISTACYVYTKEDMDRIPEYLGDPSNDDSLGSFVAWLCDQSRVLACCFSSEWVDVGTRDGLLNGNRLLISRIGRQPELIPGRYQIRKPVYIEDGVRIEDSVVGPNVFLGRGCDIRDSDVSNAIVYEDCVINSCRPFDHIVAGPHSRFEGSVGPAVYGPRTRITTLDT